MQKVEEKCCPDLNTEYWENKEHNWENKKFITDSMRTLFHMPFPWVIGKKLMKLWSQAQNSCAELENKEDTLFLFNDPSAFKSNIFLTVKNDVKDARNTTISGNFISKVYDGPYKDVPKFMKQMKSTLKKQGKEVKDFYIHYAYCPKCSKEYGHNYMVLFAKTY